jgi:hypothetical protein
MRDAAILKRDFAVVFIAGFLPWYIVLLGIFYYLFWRYLKHQDAKETSANMT